MKNLVIVESPTKARTLSKFLGSDYRIEASMGHIRDLPKSELGVDVEHDFLPKYIIPKDKQKKVTELKKLAQDADTIWLASDPDREGEAIAWHLAQIFENPKLTARKGAKVSKDAAISAKQIHRVEFHEITEGAIKEAFKHPRLVDINLVDAQQARRVLDRLVGYKLSPLLWEKVKKGLSAGRVQSVALRLIVEREREVKAFKADEYWVIEANVIPAKAGIQDDKNGFTIALTQISGKKAEVKNEETSTKITEDLKKAEYLVKEVVKKEARRQPGAPFITSTLQQAAANKLGYTAKKTMMLAQNLYENGYITYMRTDSVNLAASALEQVREFIKSNYGSYYLPKAARVFKSKSKNAQEAHEAIRPTFSTRLPADIGQENGMNRDHVKLYDLIWKRFVACQMTEAVMDQTSIDVIANPVILASEASPEPDPGQARMTYTLRATGSQIKFEGWLKVYGQVAKSKDEEQEEDEEDVLGDKILPEVEVGEKLNLQQVIPTQHFTQPPPRYNEASLIKKLEELGIGRPSTYAPTLATIQERYYVEKEDRKFIPTVLGFAAIDFLMKYFAEILDFKFTAKMENDLDEVATGEIKWQPLMQDFYGPFEKKVEKTSDTAEKMKVEGEVSGRKCPECGKDLIVKYGKFGKFLACSGFPDCKHTEGMEEPVNAKCPEDGGEVVIRKTKRGKTFYGCKNWPTCKYASWTKPAENNKEQTKNPVN